MDFNLLIQPKALFKKIYPKAVWNFNRSSQVIYLTFDDGPIPEITKWVLDELIKFNAQATFFCVGENIKQHPDIFETIIAQGHGVANHTMNHLKGFSTSTEDYLKEGVPPHRIGYLAFTKKAANEALERASDRFDLTQEDLTFFRTIHSLCYHWLGLSTADIMARSHYKEFSKIMGEPQLKAPDEVSPHQPHYFLLA